jgi:hypothetical protein
MQDTLEFPPIVVEKPPVPAATVTTIKEVVLAQFKEKEPALLALAERYRDVAFDVSKPKGLDEAKKARLDVRENGRFLIERAEKRIKSEVNDLKKVMGDEVERLVAIVKPTEDRLHEIVTTREAEIETERAEKARIEAERKQRHSAAIAKIAGYVKQAEGAALERFPDAIAYVESIDVSEATFEEFAEQAAAAKASTLEALRNMQMRALAAKAEADRIEAQRIENERVAAELAEQKRKLDAQAAELAAQQTRIATAPESSVAPPAQAVTMIPDTAAAPGGDQGHYESAPLGVIVDHDKREADYEQGKAIRAPNLLAPEVIDARPPVKLGDINERLGFNLTGAFVTSTLGIASIPDPKGRAVLFKAADLPRIKTALLQHLAKVELA